MGVVCPVYDAGLPVIVAGFAGRLDLSGVDYLFGLVTMGGAGVSALHQLDGIFQKTQGRRLDAGVAVAMPENFPPGPEKREAILAAADERLEGIARTIARKDPSPPGPRPPLPADEGGDVRILRTPCP